MYKNESYCIVRQLGVYFLVSNSLLFGYTLFSAIIIVLIRILPTKKLEVLIINTCICYKVWYNFEIF